MKIIVLRFNWLAAMSVNLQKQSGFMNKEIKYSLSNSKVISKYDSNYMQSNVDYKKEINTKNNYCGLNN